MENKYNVGEPVCVYGWVHSITDMGDKLVYGVKFKDEVSGDYCIIADVPEDIVTTVF